MSAPAPSMLQKRLYTVLPRAAASSSSAAARTRSGSTTASRSFYTAPAPSTSTSPSTTAHLQVSFFDAPPPPPRSPIITTANRLPIEAKGEAEAPTYHVPKPLALTSGPHSNSSSAYSLATAHPSLFSYQSYLSSAPLQFEPAPRPSDDRSKRGKPRYQLDVGAYGIAKKDRPSHGKRVCEDAALAVQVGEDAYFVRDNAMGVADGVGGWARTKHPDALRPALKNASPSAAFARRLMHYCASESAAAAAASHPHLSEPPTPPIPVPARPKSPSWRWVQPQSYWEEELEEELEDLSDGIDVLMILQRAYDQTLKVHVAPPSPSLPSTPPTSSSYSSSSSPPKASFYSRPSPTASTPLHVGSSTALLAILDQSPHTTACASANQPDDSLGDAVIKIAHIGDCMGMLVRGEEIVWRSEEMWYAFNAPVQLGPTSTALPTDAQVFQFPVREDDILILASDGLSDNLWDEDVLDEVVRFRRSYDVNRCEGFKGDKILRRRALAGMLSEALCSRAKRVSEQRTSEDIPFARRAREEGRMFRGGKSDDISVVVAVISPVDVEDVFETDDL